MKVGSLFSGGGLGDFGFMAAGMDIAWQCEIDEYCQKLLALRYPESKKYKNIKDLNGKELEKVDIVAGGFPCQPFSTAGLRKGSEDDRNLWPEMLQIIRDVGPKWVVGENVPGVEQYLLAEIIPSLENEGYWNYREANGTKKIAPFIIPSSAFGAHHRRDRIWIVAHSDNRRLQRIISDTPKNSESNGETSNKMAANCFIGTLQEDGRIWPSASRVCRVAYGIADRIHRLKCLGNGQVPACTYAIGKMIIDLTTNVVAESE